MSSQDDTLSVYFMDSKSVAWAVGRLMSRGEWFEYRPYQLAKNGKIAPHTVVMLSGVARALVKEFQEAQEEGEI